MSQINLVRGNLWLLRGKAVPENSRRRLSFPSHVTFLHCKNTHARWEQGGNFFFGCYDENILFQHCLHYLYIIMLSYHIKLSIS